MKNVNIEKIYFSCGVILFVLSIWLVISFVSFITTGSIDVSLIEHPKDGELLNEKSIFANFCGSMGANVAYFFMKRCYGIAAFLIPLFIFIASLTLMRAYKTSILKWFLCSALMIICLSIASARFLAGFIPNSHFNPGGDHGLFMGMLIENIIGLPGLLAILAVILLCVLAFVSTQTIDFIRKILNPAKIFDKIPFTVTPGPTTRENTNEEKANNEEHVEGDVREGNDDEQLKEESNTIDLPVNDFSSYKEKAQGLDDEEAEHVPIAVESNSTAGEEEQQENQGVVLEMEVTKTEEEAKGKSLVKVREKDLAPYDPKRDLENYRYPSLDLLKKYDDAGMPHIDMSEQTANKNRIVDVLRNFGVEISSIKATVGPTITLYEITPAQGVRISKIRNLEDDIALSLSALGIRIIAPIPGKGTIGIEVPNARPSIVSMESILNSKKFQESSMDLPCAVGKTITNEVFMFDLAKIPHLLVAGATGQGKSVGLNAIITSLLYKKHPAELKIVLIDPKKVEFSIYSPIANHFLAMVPGDNDEDLEPIITDVTKVVRTLNSLCKEMDTRYDLLKAAGTRKIKEYNKKFIARQLNPENGHKFMPYIVVIIDEFGDLIMTAGKEIELPIARIAQLARAVGIHMIIATQRPTTTIITGNIKANFPGRMAFKVSAMIDSKTILDRPGANQLIGRGDMLFLNGNEPVRVQCAFVDTPEVENINNFIANQQSYLSPFELPEPDTDAADIDGSAEVDMQHIDSMFKDAARAVVASQSGSTSLIQRKFSIGYNRAGRIMDQLEKAGIVGSASGSKPREVMIQDLNTLEGLLAAYKD